MADCILKKELAEVNNNRFDLTIKTFLDTWVKANDHNTLMRFDHQLADYLAGDALRDFFLTTEQPMKILLKDRFIACHLGRRYGKVCFDPLNGDPLFAFFEQRIYNLARRIGAENTQIPFRSVQPNKQTEAGDIADISSYPLESETLRYNSGNHFASRPANGNVFDENSKQSIGRAGADLHVLFKRGYLQDRLIEVKAMTAGMQLNNHTGLQFYVICSRHSETEGHFGASLAIMDPAAPFFPKRILVCDTLIKDLPHHPRWWNHFITAYTNVFGEGVAEIIEDNSHPLQKVNIKGDEPYRHDWDCPYYVASMTRALISLVKQSPELLQRGSIAEIHHAMKLLMPEYYNSDHQIKDRAGIKLANHMKRWNSGREMIKNLMADLHAERSYEI